MLPLQGGPELQLQLLLVLAGVHQLLVAALQLALQVFYLRAAGAAPGAAIGQLSPPPPPPWCNLRLKTQDSRISSIISRY